MEHFHNLNFLAQSHTSFSPAQLYASDADTDPQHLIYNVLEVSPNGYLALTKNPERRVDNFTQQLVNMGEIMFIHHGKCLK